MAAVTVNEQALKKEDTQASLTHEIQNLEKLLAEKRKQKEAAVKKQQFTIEKLEKLNIQQKESIKNYKSKDAKYRGKREMQQTNLMTAPRFEVILEILKKQEERIAYLERKLEEK